MNLIELKEYIKNTPPKYELSMYTPDPFIVVEDSSVTVGFRGGISETFHMNVTNTGYVIPNVNNNASLHEVLHYVCDVHNYEFKGTFHDRTPRKSNEGSKQSSAVRVRAQNFS